MYCGLYRYDSILGLHLSSLSCTVFKCHRLVALKVFTCSLVSQSKVQTLVTFTGYIHRICVFVFVPYGNLLKSQFWFAHLSACSVFWLILWHMSCQSYMAVAQGCGVSKGKNRNLFLMLQLFIYPNIAL